MKVLHINCNYTTRGLHQTMIEHLDNYVENSVFVPVSNARNTVIKPNSNVTVSECFGSKDRFFFHRKQKKIIDAIEKVYDINSFDCIHAYTVFTDGNAASYLSKKYGKPFIVTVRNTDINVFFKYMLHLRKRGREILKESKRIICLSPAYKKILADKFLKNGQKDEADSKTRIIPNGIDDFWHRNLYSDKDLDSACKRIENKELKIVYAGQINKNKNLELTAEAIKTLIAKGWTVSFLAIGEIKDEQVFSELKKLDFFSHNPAVPKEELISFYRDADLFVMPSHAETFGLVYAEAMSQGLPVIYTRGQGFDGQFREGEVGYSVNDNDASELAEKILACCENYRRLSMDSMEKAGKFNWDVVSREYAGLYEELVR